MAQLLLVNPRRRKAKRSSPARKRKTTHRRRARRSNPFPLSLSPVRRKQRRSTRRRNPVGGNLRGTAGIVAMLKEAAIGGAGALAIDVAWGQVNPHLPAAMQTTPTTVGAGDAIKALATVLLTKVSKHPMVKKAVMGSLITQIRDIASTMIPGSMGVAGVGYFTPGRVVNATARIGPNQAIQRSVSPLLNRYMRPGVTPLLNAAQPGTPSAFRTAHSSATALREGVRYR